MPMIVTVVAYNPTWADEFEREASRLNVLLQGFAQNIHHIGSTSVPGLMAKPIIDILLEVSDLERLDAKKVQMKQLGYEAMGEYGIPGRRYFRKGGDRRTHHIHAFVSGDPHLKRHLAFRDYLIAHKAIAKAYGTLKLGIVQKCNNDIGTYCDLKDPFIKLHEQKALAWYEKR